MGRRDAVQVQLEIAAEVRRIDPRFVITWEPGWESRGNGTSANYEGGVVHHTASPSSLTNPLPSQRILRDGRSDLPGPLCNWAGPACTPEAPRLHVVAAHPANHAGASGGRSMGPLPVTRLFNPVVIGLEIDYAGNRPMLPGQYYAATVWAVATARVLGKSTEWIRAHAETSVTGKWDPGYADGRTIDMAAFRRDAAGAKQGSNIVATLDQEDLVNVYKAVWFGTAGAPLLPREWPAGAEWPATAIGSLTARINRDVVGPQVALLRGEIAGLLKALSATPGHAVDLDAIRAAARAGAEDALSAGVNVDVTVGGQDPAV